MSANFDPHGDRKKALAPFYTPRVVASALTDWAIADTHATVLDPSYGGCAFLYAAEGTLRSRGNTEPGSMIYGVDIDPDARSYLGPLFECGARPEQFLTADFFEVDQDQFLPRAFDAVVGNPPFIRHHDISDAARGRAAARLRSYGIEVSGRASYWALFLLYSIQFLRPGGRLAMVVPTALLHADYSAPVRESLIERFETVAVCLLTERIFDDTDEQVALVCAAGAQRAHRRLRIGAAARIQDIPDVLQRLHGVDCRHDTLEVDDDWMRALLDPGVRTALDELDQRPDIVRLGEWAKAGIGVVTGHNRFFVLSREDQLRRGIPDSNVTPVVRRPSYLRGLSVSDGDLQAAIPDDHGSLLLTVSQAMHDLPVAVQEYIQHGREMAVHEGRKCRERHPWYALRDLAAPPAFVQCMSANWPRLVLNRSSFTCTNNILRLHWLREPTEQDRLRLAMGTLSTLSQLSAELVGRSYGGGVLKVEPGELAHLRVPLLPEVGVESLARDVDALLRKGQTARATEVVDDALRAAGGAMTRDVVTRLRRARDLLRNRRRGRKRAWGSYTGS